jgi:N-acetylmuramoyl-L-alanine amidase
MKKPFLAVVGILILTIVSTGQTQDESEHPQISQSSDDFVRSSASAIEKLKEAKFEDRLERPGFGAVSQEKFEQLVAQISKEAPIKGVELGDRGKKYDVILQPGHYLRATGRVGTTGKFVSERALAAYITNILAQQLRDDGDSVLVVSADHYLRPSSNTKFDGLTSKIFLAIHLDGSSTPCQGKASLAYPKGSLSFSMHTVGYSLAEALGYNPTDFERDNYTVNEAHYYMFSQVRADRLTGLLEVGELTCELKEKQFIVSADVIAQNVAEALDYVVKLQAGTN